MCWGLLGNDKNDEFERAEVTVESFHQIESYKTCADSCAVALLVHSRWNQLATSTLHESQLHPRQTLFQRFHHIVH